MKKIIDRLNNLDSFENQPDFGLPIMDETKRIELTNLSDKLGRAGYYNDSQRKTLKRALLILISATTFISFAIALQLSRSVPISCLFAMLGLYTAYAIYLGFLKSKTAERDRLILFQTPLLLEALIQLVESGMGLLPAIYKVVEDSNSQPKNSPKKTLKIVYELSASGLPFGKALRSVAEVLDSKILRHVLLHLDISGNEGGELIPSLRSLSDHSHTTWKLSVEQRVKRLENLVIFPVFFAVLGLLCLSASVPLYPIIEFMGKQKPVSIDAYANK